MARLLRQPARFIRKKFRQGKRMVFRKKKRYSHSTDGSSYLGSNLHDLNADTDHDIDTTSDSNQDLLKEIWKKYEENVVKTEDKFECCICLEDVASGQGVRLQECLHEICRDCLREHIKKSSDAVIKCPVYGCEFGILPREFGEILDSQSIEHVLNRSIQKAKAEAEDIYDCRQPDCPASYVLDDGDMTFMCIVCNQLNCVPCKAVHAPLPCEEYKKNKDDNDAIYAAIDQKLVMRCPKCKILLQKDDGCDYMVCSLCETEICWPTRGPRWGPKGRGDTSGGCRCRVINDQPCHPQCSNCH